MPTGMEWRGCLLIDIYLPVTDSLALQNHLIAGGCWMMTGHGNVKSTREVYSQLTNDGEPCPPIEQHCVWESRSTRGVVRI